MIDLWIFYDFSEDGKKELYNKIIDDINCEDNNKVVESINIVKCHYPELFNLNADCLEKLRFDKSPNQTQYEIQYIKFKREETPVSKSNSASDVSKDDFRRLGLLLAIIIVVFILIFIFNYK